MSLSGLYYLTGMSNTHMVTGGGLRPRLDSALVAKWPDPLDISTDIFIPGKTAAFKSQLIAALQSRDLWSAISTTDPTIESITLQNPQATRDEVEEALRTAMAYRQYQKTTLATLLPQLLKQSSLTYMQNEHLSALVTTGDGVVI